MDLGVAQRPVLQSQSSKPCGFDLVITLVEEVSVGQKFFQDQQSIRLHLEGCLGPPHNGAQWLDGGK